jgi:hypothetical protein
MQIGLPTFPCDRYQMTKSGHPVQKARKKFDDPTAATFLLGGQDDPINNLL